MPVVTDLPDFHPQPCHGGAGLTQFDSQSPSVGSAGLSFRHSEGRSLRELPPTHISVVTTIVVLLSPL